LAAFGNRVQQVLPGIEDLGPEIDLTQGDIEAATIGIRLGIPVESVFAVKYLAENGPDYEEMEADVWNTPFLNEESDKTICPYNMCDGYKSEFSHNSDCPYTIALELLNEWRQQVK
jgi:hypothetical protein